MLTTTSLGLVFLTGARCSPTIGRMKKKNTNTGNDARGADDDQGMDAAAMKQVRAIADEIQSVTDELEQEGISRPVLTFALLELVIRIARTNKGPTGDEWILKSAEYLMGDVDKEVVYREMEKRGLTD